VFNPLLDCLTTFTNTSLSLPQHVFEVTLDSNLTKFFMFDKPSAPDQSLNSAIAAELDDFIIAHSTTPNIKLYYPEPFIASPTFNHDDI